MDDLSRLQVRATAALRLRDLEHGARYATHAWEFLTERVQLLDPLRPQDPIRPYPPLPYLQICVQEAEAHRRLIVWKPRRKRLSWTFLAYGVAKASTIEYQRVFLISRRLGEDDTQGSRELLWRAGFILGHLRGYTVAYEQGKFLIELPTTGSTIAAVSSEPNALRAVAGTLVIGDEFAFWDDPEASLSAILPTGEREGEIVGQFVGITSTEVGPFERMLYDGQRSDEVALDETGIPRWATHVTRYERDGIPPGACRAWTNPENGFRVLDLHLEADPATRDSTAIARLQASVPVDIWEREYRKHFVGRGGTPIFGKEYRADLHVSESVLPVIGEPIICGIDFGYHRPAAVALQLLQRQGGLQLRIYRGLIGEETTTRAFVHLWLAKVELWFPDWRFGMLWACDHSGNRKRGEDETAFDVLHRDFGIKARSRYALLPPTLDLVRDFLQRMCGKEPALLIDKNPDTAFLRRGFAGEYRYGRATEVNPNPEEPERGNAFRDIMDAIRYGVMNYVGPRRVDPERRARLLAASRRFVRPGRQYVR
jgi:hypothetical protein